MAEFNLYALPLELPLEIFGFLSHDDWTRLAGFNRRTHNVMMNNLRYLAPLTHCAYLHMQMSYHDYRLIDITTKADKYMNIDKDMIQLKEILPKIPEKNPDQKETLYWLIFTDQPIGKPPQGYVIQLPLFPKTIEELALVCFWLNALSQVSFVNIHMKYFFSPQIFALLHKKDMPFRLRCSKNLNMCCMDITSTLAPHICASSIKIFMNDKEKISEIIHFLCKTSVVPAKVSISGLMEKNDPNDYQALFQACHEIDTFVNRFPRLIEFNISTLEKDGQMEWMAELRAALGNDADIFIERETHMKNKKRSYEITNNKNKKLKFEIIIMDNEYGYEILVSQNTTPSSI